MVATLEKPFDLSSEHEHDINHIVCCVDNDRSFCGEDMSDASWVPDEATINCSECQETYRQHSQCPFGKVCPE